MQEQQLLDTLSTILDHGEERIDRTGVGTKSIFGVDMRFNLQNHSFPLMTTRKLSLRMVFEELMWFLRGQTDVGILRAKKVPVWNPNSSREFLDSRGLTHYKEGDIGPAYGHQFRHFGAPYTNCDTDYSGQGFDQLEYVIDLLKNNPTSRRILMNIWNPAVLDEVALPPCLFCYQFYVSEGKYLSCKLTQRSSDISLAGGWNIATGSLLVYMLSAICGYEPKELVWSIGDCHIYLNQLDGVREQLKRSPRTPPKLHVIKTPDDITKFEYDCFRLEDYSPHPAIKLKLNA